MRHRTVGKRLSGKQGQIPALRGVGENDFLSDGKYAAAVFIIYLVLFLFAGLVISSIEGLPVIDCLYETASAIGTVGLTLGITPGLSSVSHVILISLMFLGRVGGLTLLYAFFGTEKTHMSHLPQEQVAVG